MNDSEQWKQVYTYDRYGNRLIHQTHTWGDGIPKPNFTVSTANNCLGVPGGQPGTMRYDDAGNLTTDTYSAGANNHRLHPRKYHHYDEAVSGAVKCAEGPGVNGNPRDGSKAAYILTFNKERVRLQYFAAALRQQPKVMGFIVVHNSLARDNAAPRRAKRARKYLVNAQGLPAERVEVVEGNYTKTPTVELYLGPLGMSGAERDFMRPQMH